MRTLIVLGSLLFAAFGLTAFAGEAKFTKKPTASKAGDTVKIEFALAAETDVAVYVLDSKGKTVRHLVAGVLGKNPPEPLKPGLAQSIEWDMRDNEGKPAAGGPFKVRVALGVKPEFDSFLLYNPDAMPVVSALAPGPKGNLYVFYQDPTANGNQGGHKIRIIDRQGKFVRQILPFPSDLPFEKVQGTGTFQDEDGHVVPNAHNWHSLNFYQDTVLARGRSMSRFSQPVVDEQGRIYWLIKGGRLCAIDADGGVPWDGFMSSKLFPDVETVAPGRPVLALSSDGKSLYAAGIYSGSHDKIKPLPCVYRIDLAKPAPAEVFLGKPGEPGKEKDLFTAPRGVAAAKGLLYVADPEAGRVAVFKEADRSFVGEIKVSRPHLVQVHPETEAVYVASYVPDAKPRKDGKILISGANLLKYASYKDAKPAYQMALPKTGLSPNGGTHRIALDASAEQPLIWAPGVPYARSMEKHIGCYRDTGTAFEPVEIEMAKGPWGQGPRDMLVDRRRGDFYVKITGEQWHQFDDATGEYKRLVKFPKNAGGPSSGAHGANLGVDSAGNYITHCWGDNRGLIRWTNDLKPLNWEGQNTHRTEWGGMMTFQLNYMTIFKDQIYFIKRNKGQPHHLDVWDMGLKPQRRVVYNVRTGSCPRVDAAGNIYITVPLRPLDRDFQEFFDDKLEPIPDGFKNIGEGRYWYTYMAGAIVKFPPEGGAFYWTDDKRAGHDVGGLSAEIAAKPREKYNYFLNGRSPHKECEVQGAEWIRFDYSPYSETYGAGTPVCMCEGAGFDVDPFGRVWYTNLFRFRVEVVDTNNNFITHFGKYGNQDSGPEGRVKTPEIPLAWPTYVAASDTHAYVNDTIGMRVVKVKLGHEAEETCAVK